MKDLQAFLDITSEQVAEMKPEELLAEHGKGDVAIARIREHQLMLHEILTAKELKAQTSGPAHLAQVVGTGEAGVLSALLSRLPAELAEQVKGFLGKK